MKPGTILWAVATAMLAFVWNDSWAQSPQGSYRSPLEQLQLPPGEPYLYGWQLMTGAERELMQQRLSRAQSEEERQQIQADHHRQMEERARQQGYSLPNDSHMRNQSMMHQQLKKPRRGKPG
jgi:hypothetical protein